MCADDIKTKLFFKFKSFYITYFTKYIVTYVNEAMHRETASKTDRLLSLYTHQSMLVSAEVSVAQTELH